jgi:hypothetical protein
MEQDLQQEITEAITNYTLGGFIEDEDTLLDVIAEMFYEEELDEDWIAQEIHRQYAARIAAQQSWPAQTDFDRLALVFDSLNEQGIIALHNAGYTRQDGEGDTADLHHRLKEEGINTIGYCFYHQQDLERVISGYNLYLAFGAFEAGDAEGVAIGEKIVLALEKHGFNYNWNHTLDTRIDIPGIKWQKRFDNENCSEERAMDLLSGK